MDVTEVGGQTALVCVDIFIALLALFDSGEETEAIDGLSFEFLGDDPHGVSFGQGTSISEGERQILVLEMFRLFELHDDVGHQVAVLAEGDDRWLDLVVLGVICLCGWKGQNQQVAQIVRDVAYLHVVCVVLD